jgi:hypothetical protein
MLEPRKSAERRQPPQQVLQPVYLYHFVWYVNAHDLSRWDFRRSLVCRIGCGLTLAGRYTASRRLA